MAICAMAAMAELKSVSGASPGEGGYAVPREIDALISAQLKRISPIRSDRPGRPDRQRRLSQADHHRRHGFGLGQRDRRRGR